MAVFEIAVRSDAIAASKATTVITIVIRCSASGLFLSSAGLHSLLQVPGMLHVLRKDLFHRERIRSLRKAHGTDFLASEMRL
jgi:hypothetical protein